MQGLRLLLQNVIDYAGTFPPARLALPDSLSKYLAYRSGPESWILRHFVVASDNLMGLAELLESADIVEPLSLSVIGERANSQDDWERCLASDAQRLNDFNSRIGEKGNISTYETRLTTGMSVEQAVRDLQGFEDAEVFLEVGWTEDLVSNVVALSESAGDRMVYAKARAGGQSRADYPTSANLAEFIQVCIQTETPFKLTAGLHNPWPVQLSEFDNVRMHGFVNSIAATALAIANDLNRKEIADIIIDDRAANYTFSPAGLQFGELKADKAAIAEARSLFLSFGSCSIKEPLDGLEAAGLVLPGKAPA